VRKVEYKQTKNINEQRHTPTNKQPTNQPTNQPTIKYRNHWGKNVKLIHTTKFAIAPLNPLYIHTISILYPLYGNIQLL
jgi:hypothetical protein